MSNKKYGLNGERKEKKYLLEHGELGAYRCRGSFGRYDIISSNGERFMLTQVKATRKNRFNYNKEIEEIYQDKKHPEGTIKQLVVYHQGKRILLAKFKIIKIQPIGEKISLKIS